MGGAEHAAVLSGVLHPSEGDTAAFQSLYIAGCSDAIPHYYRCQWLPSGSNNYRHGKFAAACS